MPFLILRVGVIVIAMVDRLPDIQGETPSTSGPARVIRFVMNTFREVASQFFNPLLHWRSSPNSQAQAEITMNEIAGWKRAIADKIKSKA